MKMQEWERPGIGKWTVESLADTCFLYTHPKGFTCQLDLIPAETVKLRSDKMLDLPSRWSIGLGVSDADDLLEDMDRLTAKDVFDLLQTLVSDLNKRKIEVIYIGIENGSIRRFIERIPHETLDLHVDEKKRPEESDAYVIKVQEIANWLNARNERDA